VRARLAAAARAAGRAQAAVLLTAVYWLALGPAALVSRLFGADPLSTRRPVRTAWVPRPRRTPRETLEGAG
jgi:hypothetical protein